MGCSRIPALMLWAAQNPGSLKLLPPFGSMQGVLHVKTVSCWWTNKKKAACTEVLTGDTACCLGLVLSMIANIKRG